MVLPSSKRKPCRHGAAYWTASLMHVGRFPVAPGTVCTLVWGIPMYLVLGRLPAWAYALMWMLLLIPAVWSADRTERRLGSKDPSDVVIDELVGFLIAVAWLPYGLKTAVAGFLLFRFFDIVKVFPVNWLDSRLPGGWGIVMDDVAAGLQAQILLRLILWIQPSILFLG